MRRRIATALDHAGTQLHRWARKVDHDYFIDKLRLEVEAAFHTSKADLDKNRERWRNAFQQAKPDT